MPFLSCSHLINRRRWLLYFECALAVVNLFVCVLVLMNQQNRGRRIAVNLLSCTPSPSVASAVVLSFLGSGSDVVDSLFIVALIVCGYV